jgi:hypothetical protein
MVFKAPFTYTAFRPPNLYIPLVSTADSKLSVTGMIKFNHGKTHKALFLPCSADKTQVRKTLDLHFNFGRHRKIQSVQPK